MKKNRTMIGTLIAVILIILLLNPQWLPVSMETREKIRDLEKSYFLIERSDTILIGRISCGWMNRVTCRIDGDVGSNLTVVADHYFAHVDDRAVVVAEEILADFNVEAIVTVERRIDKGALRLAEQFLYDSADALEISAVHRVELLGETPGAFLLFKDGFIGNIQNSVISAFDIVHGIPSLSLLFLLYPQMGKYCMERARIGCRFRRKTSQNAII